MPPAPDLPGSRVAIVDYGMGNLFSVRRACEQAGLSAAVTSSREEVLAADAVILPGVGAFGDAMETLNRLDLAAVLRDFAASGKPLVGICLGMQLLLTEGHEFGRHRGLDILEGDVVRLQECANGGRRMKVPQVGWNQIHAVDRGSPSRDVAGRVAGPPSSWLGTPLQGVRNGEFMYFVHSFYPRPNDEGVVLSTTKYGHAEFCSSLRRGNVFACQFHPERSGSQGIGIYRNLAALLGAPGPERSDA